MPSEVGSTCALSHWLLTAQDPAVLLCQPESIMGQIVHWPMPNEEGFALISIIIYSGEQEQAVG